jgi:hypothetical protein
MEIRSRPVRDSASNSACYGVRMDPKQSSMALVYVVMASLSGVACGDDDGGKATTTGTTEEGTTTTTGPGTVGPTTGVETTGETTGVATTGATTTGETTGATTGGATGETGETTGETTGGVGPALPATHRFDCLDVVDLGDSNGDGQPDGGAIQALLLENTWSSDIDEFRLNVLLTVQSVDAAAGMAEMVIASGIGLSVDDQCRESSTISPTVSASFDPAVAAWQPLAAPGSCAEPAMAGAPGFGGTYTLELGPQDTISIYAQEVDGTALNCVAGDAVPDAVPLHAVRATITMDANEEIGAGELTGCLLVSEAEELCSCLSECNGSGHADCTGCPDGSVPLAALLGGVATTQSCSNLMGEPAFDLRLRFATQRLAIEEPMTCQGP